MAMMSSTKLDVVWSPVHHKNFVIWGSDITLYEVSRLQDIDKNTSYQQISPTRGAKVIASQSASHIRCVDMCAMEEHSEPLLAVGYNSGKVALTTLKQTQEPRDLVGREFVPRYSRLCNSVSWNHVEKHFLLSGLDKHKSDHSILLWDVTRIPDEQPDPNAPLPPEWERPVSEMGLAETVHSVSWVKSAPRSILASMSLKYIKLFDIRELSNKSVSTATTRYCYNACADPLSPHQLASRGDNVVCIWDDRSLVRPLLTLPQPRPVARIQWCPTRRNLLVSLQRDATTIKLHEIQVTGERPVVEPDPAPSAPRNSGEIETESPSRASTSGAGSAAAAQPPAAPSVMERELNPNLVSEPAPLAAFACHPEHEARLLALCQSGVVSDYTVRSRVCVSWGAGAGVAWSAGQRGGVGGLLHLLPPAFYTALGDIQHRILQRAKLDYGLKPDLWQNADIPEDEALSSLWHFLALSKSLVEDGCIRNSPWKHPGVRTVLGPPGEGYRSETTPTVLPDMPNRRVAIYRSAERTRSLQVCGWGWGWESAGAGVERAEAEGTPCRAAAIAAFHLRLRTAFDILARAPQPQLQVAALALAGLTEERLWREVGAGCCAALPDAYLRALLHFLRALVTPQHAPHATPAADFSLVLAETGMRLEDRVSFACIFLPDAKLHEYVKQTSDELVEKGDLSGLLLTGTSPEGVDLLQRYLNNTGDVQTVALVAARCFTPDLLRDHRVQHWLDSYRTLLNSVRMYAARCALDTWVCGAEGGVGGAGARAVGVACAYCGRGVGAPHSAARARPRLPPPAATLKQVSSCGNCRKPLPRCGVCGVQVCAGGAAFPAWFTFCPNCRHGGHAHHMLGWFQDHYECPVSSCTCRCNMLDPPDPKHRFNK